MVTRREEQQEEAEFETHAAGLRAQVTPPPGSRPALLSEVAGPQAAVTVGCVAAGPPSLVVALVAVHDHVDQASVQFLLQQSFLAHAAGEEKAREEAEVKMLEDDVADKESLLLEELCKVRDGVWLPWSKFSGVEKVAVHWHVALVKARKKKGSKKRKKRSPPHRFDLFLALFALRHLDIIRVVLPGVRCLDSVSLPDFVCHLHPQLLCTDLRIFPMLRLFDAHCFGCSFVHGVQFCFAR